MPNPTSPRVLLAPKGAGACLAGLDKLLLGDLIFGESVYSAVLHRPQHRPGSPNQAQTWPYGSTYSIVQETPALAEIGSIYFSLWCAKNGVRNQFSHSLLIEMPSRDSLLARTEINTQDRQESAVEAVSAVSACHRLPLQASRATSAAASHSQVCPEGCPECSPPGQSLCRITVRVTFDISNTTNAYPRSP
jgi:hypothetical protein